MKTQEDSPIKCANWPTAEQTPRLRRRKQPFWFPSQQTNLTGNKKSELGTHKKSNTIHPGKLTWNLKIAYLKRKIIFQTFTIVFHVNFQGCRVNHFVYGCLLSLGGRSVVWFLSWNLGPKGLIKEVYHMRHCDCVVDPTCCIILSAFWTKLLAICLQKAPTLCLWNEISCQSYFLPFLVGGISNVHLSQKQNICL